MNCSCVYVGFDTYDTPEFHKAIIRKAIKEHKCCECNRIISIGEKYENVSGSWDGHFSTYKTCEDCLSIRNELFCEGWFYEQIFEYLHEYLNECNGEVPAECLLSLTPNAMTKVCGMIDEIWEDD